jgi:uncharacterized protein YacL
LDEFAEKFINILGTVAFTILTIQIGLILGWVIALICDGAGVSFLLTSLIAALAILLIPLILGYLNKRFPKDAVWYFYKLTGDARSESNVEKIITLSDDGLPVNKTAE